MPLFQIACVLLWWSMLYLGYGSFSSYSIVFHFTYKSAAECEAKIHSKRMQLLFGLRSNVEKILFWQDFHLWKRKRGIYLKMHIIKESNYTFKKFLIYGEFRKMEHRGYLSINSILLLEYVFIVVLKVCFADKQFHRLHRIWQFHN